MLCPRCRSMLNPGQNPCPHCGLVFSALPFDPIFQQPMDFAAQNVSSTRVKRTMPLWTTIAVSLLACCITAVVAIPVTANVVARNIEKGLAQATAIGKNVSDASSSRSSSGAAAQSTSASSAASTANTINDATSGATQSNSSTPINNATPVALNQTVTTDKWTFTLANAEWAKELNPPDTSGVYSYMSAEAGKTFLVIKGTFKNLAGETYDLK